MGEREAPVILNMEVSPWEAMDTPESCGLAERGYVSWKQR